MIIFLGPPGSGKGTQAHLLKKRLSIECFSVGDLLRKEVSNNSSIGLLIKEKLQDGNLVPTKIIVDLLKQSLTDNNFVLDGFPRNLEQAYELDVFLLSKIKNYIIFDFVLPKELIVSRLADRKMCSNCHSPNFSIITKCMCCDCQTYYTRSDDNLETIKNRVEIYSTEHAKILNHYENNNCFMSINANQDVETVYETIRTCLINKNLL